MPDADPSLVEFPADDPERARRFWGGLLGAELEPRADEEGQGWQTHPETGLAIGVHERGRGPGDSFSLALLHGRRHGGRRSPGSRSSAAP